LERQVVKEKLPKHKKRLIEFGLLKSHQERDHLKKETEALQDIIKRRKKLEEEIRRIEMEHKKKGFLPSIIEERRKKKLLAIEQLMEQKKQELERLKKRIKRDIEGI